jgi:hypothetical protein
VELIEQELHIRRDIVGDENQRRIYRRCGWLHEAVTVEC